MNALATANITPINREPEQRDGNQYTQVNTRYEHQHRLQWCYINPQPRPCFNPTVLKELNHLLVTLKENGASSNTRPVKYHAFTSELNGIFNTGGDLSLFKTLILSRDRTQLTEYARSCISAIYHSHTLHQHGITEIAVTQGDALGGGFECVLSADIIIAERSAKMGLPEVLFNLFPGMGAYSLLSRRLGPAKAEQVILSGKLYSAEEMYRMGVVDILVDDGHGEQAVYDYIHKEERSRNTIQALRQVKDRCHPLTWAELDDIVAIWVEAALRLSSRDLRMMDRLVSRQKTTSYGAV